MKTMVYLIGSGPGDPGLLTLRGAECLRRSQAVLYDGLSNVEMLRHAPQAKHICVGKHGQSRIWKQTEIIEEMLRHAQAGNTVARLKGGDPAVFARTAEEIDALKAADVPFEVVPGITAALAAGSYAGIPITHRKLASAVALVTGHEEPGKTESALDWDALARFPGTLVIYMGVTTANVWTEALISSGKDPATPTALIRRCSLPDQETVHCRLDEVTERFSAPNRLRPPVIAIIGAVTNLAETMDWIGQRPLQGKTILVTRPARQAVSSIDAITEMGGKAILAPAISIQPTDDCRDLDECIADLPETDVLIFCSVNGVEAFFGRLGGLGYDCRELAGVQIATIGSRTDKRLADFGIISNFVPDGFRASSLIKTLEPWIDGKRVTIIRASRGSDELPNGLMELGAKVHEVVAYMNTDIQQPDPNTQAMLREGKIDWVTVTSSATANNLYRLYGDDLRTARIAAISPITAQTLSSHGLAVDVVADPHTFEQLLKQVALES